MRDQHNETPNAAYESLHAKQQEMEDHAMALGGQRFKAKLEKAVQKGSESGVGAAKKLLRDGLVGVEEALQLIVKPQVVGKGKPPSRSVARKWITLVGPDVAAYLTLKVLLDHIHSRVTVRKAAFEVTELILDELRYRRFREKAPRLFEYSMAGFTTSSYSHRARSLDARIHYAQVDISDLSMTQAERCTVGVKLLDVAREVTGLVQVEKSKRSKTQQRAGKKRRHTHVPHDLVELVATPETLSWLKEGNSVLEFVWPVNLPMVMGPLPWSPSGRGGYRFALRGKHPLVRKSHQIQPGTSMPQVYAAVNRIQETAWRVNARVKETIEALVERGGGIAGLPRSSDKPLPPKPESMEGRARGDVSFNVDVEKAWRRAAHAVHEENHEHREERRELFNVLLVANKVCAEDAIWFPHNLDFRGRVYPVVNYLHPQGNDVCKGLLEFADGKPVGKEGAMYLALHGAACMDKTRDGLKLGHLTIQERLAWVESIEPEVVAIAADPLGHTMWMDAEEPWQFLAWCFDYAGFIREGSGYVSNLPVAMDGTCNGLQHFAALWLDPRGAKAVNVLPSERPQDIYQAVADEVLDKLERDSGNEFAALWLRSGLVDRSLCKRPVMTFGYGSEKYGFAQQLHEKAREAIHADTTGTLRALFSTQDDPPRSTLFPACAYLARCIWDALQVVSVSAFEGMAWMRACAKVISKDAGQPVRWVVPGTGFPVSQGYVEQTRKQAETILAGSVFKPSIYVDTGKTAWKKQTSSVAPNVVHSLDAAALMLTVNMAAAEGVEHFAMIHDSYGTLAGDAQVLARCTRAAFHQLYTQQDVVGELHRQFREQCLVVPPPPPKGDLDLGQVLVSPYFFS